MSLLTTRDVAERLNVSEEWVRDHRYDLGAIRLGNDRNGQLRFDEQGIQQYLEQRRLARPAAPARRGGRPRGVTRRIPADVGSW